jgi:hypothetical protein
MTTRIWVKLYIEILDDPKMGRLTNHLWRRAVELFLLAGREGNDGALPPVEEMAWILRLSEDKVLEDLHGLAEVGVVHEAKPGVWFVTNFKKRQTSESYDRVKRYRERYSNGTCNGEVAGVASTSSSPSLSFSDSVSSEEGVQGEKPCVAPRLAAEPAGESPGKEADGENLPIMPSSPAEAMLHPDVRVFSAVTGGRIPGLSQYRAVVDAVRILRQKKQLDDRALVAYLAPYWLTWSGRKRQDGQPYEPGNISWLTDWALNGTIPGGKKKEVDVVGKVDQFLNRS